MPLGTLPELENNPSVGTGPHWVVRVFNDEDHTYAEVMLILMIATHCTEEEAYNETWEIDHLGSSVVHHGNQEDCEKVQEVIATIGIRVEVAME